MEQISPKRLHPYLASASGSRAGWSGLGRYMWFVYVYQIDFLTGLGLRFKIFTPICVVSAQLWIPHMFERSTGVLLPVIVLGSVPIVKAPHRLPNSSISKWRAAFERGSALDTCCQQDVPYMTVSVPVHLKFMKLRLDFHKTKDRYCNVVSHNTALLWLCDSRRYLQLIGLSAGYMYIYNGNKLTINNLTLFPWWLERKQCPLPIWTCPTWKIKLYVVCRWCCVAIRRVEH